MNRPILYSRPLNLQAYKYIIFFSYQTLIYILESRDFYCVVVSQAVISGGFEKEPFFLSLYGFPCEISFQIGFAVRKESQQLRIYSDDKYHATKFIFTQVHIFFEQSWNFFLPKQSEKFPCLCQKFIFLPSFFISHTTWT